MKKNLRIMMMLAIVLAIVFVAGCTGNQSAPKSTTPDAENSATQTENEASTAKGEVVTIKNIENLEGGYTIPIADSWLGKVSYEMNGTQTIFYHITNDENEMEINPVLMNINVSDDPEADSLAAEVFLEIGGLKYYNIPRFDFPYNQGSPDAIEFEQFSNDILMLLQSAWVLDESQWQEQVEETLATQGTQTGEDITDNTIYTKDGFLSVFVPNSWIGKASYVADVRSISFYHITKDQAQYEINPLIMTIEVADGVLEGGVEEVYLNYGYAFFYIPRFDFPYTDGECEDGAEFKLLYEDARFVLETCEVSQTPSMGQASTFTKFDARIGAIFIGDSKETVLAAVDEVPLSIETNTWEATGETEEVYEFSFGTLAFMDNMFYNATITDSSIYGPRDITIGTSLNDIVELFTSDVEKDTDEATIFYRANSGSDETVEVPPYGVLRKGDENILRYGCFYDESEVAGMTIEQLEMEFWFFAQYNCAFYFDKNDKLVSYSVGISLPAE